MGDVCACDIHESGRGLVPCLHHAQRIAEHQAMYRALDALRNGKVDTDPGAYADMALFEVSYWHG